LNKDLNLDSLDTVELVIAAEEEFHLEIPDHISETFETPKDIANYIFKAKS